MELALEQGRKALLEGEVPVGAVVVVAGTVVGVGHNRREQDINPVSHAEIEAIQMAAKTLGTWKLPKSTLYVTLEPCVMCAGAIMQARIERVVYGAKDLKAGGVRSLHALLEDPRMPHRCKVIEGVMAEECSALLNSFFKQLRDKS